MKQIIKIIGVALLMTAFAQSSTAQTNVGGGLTFFKFDGGSEIGLNIKSTFSLTEKFEISPAINYYFVDGYTLMGLNGDFHYLLGDEDGFTFYPSAGINILRSAVSGFSSNTLGFNLGAGARLPVSESLSIYADGQYRLSDFSGLVFSVGVLFSI